MDEMYENNTDNMEHYQYDPNLLQCESCLQKDELIDNMTQELLSCQRGVVRFRTERNAYIELASKNWTERVKFKEDSLKYMKLYKVTQKILQQYYKHGYEHGIYEYLLLGMCEEFKEQRANLTEELDKLKKNFEDSTSESSAKGEKCRQLEALVFEHEKVLNIHKKCKKSIKDKISEVRRTVRLEVRKALRKIAKLKNYNMLDITNAIKAIENETVKTCEKSAEGSDWDEEATSNSHLSVKNRDHSEDDIGDLESVCDSIEEHMPPIQGNRLLQSPNIQINNAKASYSIVTHLHSTADNSNVDNNDHFNDISDLESVTDYPEKGEGVQLEVNKDSIVKITHCSENYGCHAVLTSSDDIEATVPEREATSNSFSDKHIEQGGENQSLCWTDMDLGEDISDNMPEHVTDDNNFSEEEVYSMIHKQKSEWLVFSRPAVTPTSPSIPTTSSDGIVSSEHVMAGLNEQKKSIQTDNISAFAAISVMKHKEAENIGRGAEFNDSDFDENAESNCQEPSFHTKPAEFECSPNTDSLYYFDISDFNIEESHSSLGMVCDVSTDKTDPQERSYLSDSYLELPSALIETMESTSYTCNNNPDEYFYDITIESEQQEEFFESELQEGSYQNSNPEESYQNSNPEESYQNSNPEESYQNSNPEESYQNSNPEESYQNSNPEESYQNSNPEESPPTEITEGCYSEESVSDKMIKQTQLCSTI